MRAVDSSRYEYKVVNKQLITIRKALLEPKPPPKSWFSTPYFDVLDHIIQNFTRVHIKPRYSIHTIVGVFCIFCQVICGSIHKKWTCLALIRDNSKLPGSRP